MRARLAEAFPTFTRWSTARGARATARALGVTATTAGRILISAPVLGAAYLTLMTWLSMRGPMVADEEHLLGSSRAELVDLVWFRYAADFNEMVTVLIVTAVVAGATMGVIAGGIVASAAFVERRTPRPLERAAWALGLIVLVQAATVAWAMATYPQVYERAWNAQGGWRRAIQTLVALRLGPAGVIAVALAAVALAALVPPLLRRSRPGAREWRRRSELARLSSGAAALLAAWAAFACAPREAAQVPEPRAADDARPNVVLLAADSLRNDRLVPSVMPAASRLAERSTRFTRAYISTPRTLPSWTTLLTGQWAHHHGIRTSFPTVEQRRRPYDTIVSRFASAGYATSVASDYVGDIFALANYGFQDVDAPPLQTFHEYVRQGVLRRARPLLPFLHTHLGRWLAPSIREIPFCADANLLADDVIAAIRRNTRRPFFLVGFFGASHVPYASPAPYFDRFADRSYEGEFRYDKLVWDPAFHPNDAETRQVRALYDGAAASFDAALARVVDELDRSDVAGRTIVVVLADHGESLYEAGRFGHGSYVVGDEAMHIPLVIFDPRAPGGRKVDDIVRDVDLASTLCDLAGVPCPAAMDGESFAGALRGAPVAPHLTFGETELWFDEGIPDLRIPYPVVTKTAMTDTQHGDIFVMRPEYEALVTFAKHRMVFDGRWKLVYMPTPETPRYALYDDATDPLESADVSAEHPEEVARLKAPLWAWMLQDPAMEERHGWLAPRGVPIFYVDGNGAR